MRKTILILLVASSLHATAQDKEEREVLRSCLRAWTAVMQQNGVDYTDHLKDLKTLRFAEIKPDLLGVTSRHSDRIELSRGVMKRGTWTTLATFFHEMGHYYGLNHKATGIMYYRAKSESEFKAHWSELVAEYVKEMKNRNR